MKRLLIAMGLIAALGACGGDSAEPAAQTITIEMRDNEFVPASIDVTAGEEVELRFTNKGTVTHDAFIGTASQQREHEKSMRDGGGHDHGDKDGVTVEKGETESLRYTFDAEDDGILIGCHEPGHYGSGMKLTVNVS